VRPLRIQPFLPLLSVAVLSHFLVIDARAEWITSDVRGKGAKGESDHPAISCILLNTGNESDGVMAVVTISEEFGMIESAILVVYDAEKKLVARAVLGAQVVEKGRNDYELNVRRELIENAYVVVSRRDKDNLHFAKVHMGTFPINEKKNKPK
jgi:hypothetical protein